MAESLALVFAFVLDLGIGDPVYSYHPARVMGKVIEKLERVLRGKIQSEKFAGALLSLSLPALVFSLVWTFIFLLGKIHPALAWLVNLLGIYAAISICDLRKEAMQIYNDLGQGDLEKARTDLSRIVGRDTEALDAEGIARASIETVAESTVDGILAPLFYAALGGAPLALAYKAVNTLDSMIGHQNERYRDFGFFAAKQDEFWNWIPARLSLFLTAVAVFLMRGRVRQTWQTGWRDALRASRGNSAIPEASFAGALGVRLGGASFYQGRCVEKPFLGAAEKELCAADLHKSIQLMLAVSCVGLIAALLLRFFIERI